VDLSGGGNTCAINEIGTKTHESWGREPTEAYKGKKTKGESRRKELDMKRCCQSRTTNLTLRVSDTECTGRAVWSKARLRRAPRVGNIDEGRTVMIWTLLKASCVNKGLEVRGDGGTVS
jgi:hypothetical protein